MSLEKDTTQFRKAIKTYMKATTRELPEVINTKAYFVVRNAMQRTRKANKAEIQKFFKNSNRKKRDAYVMAYFKLNKATTSWELEPWIKKLRGMRVKSVGYLRAGWIPALRAFSKAAKGKGTFKGVRMVGRPGSSYGNL